MNNSHIISSNICSKQMALKQPHSLHPRYNAAHMKFHSKKMTLSYSEGAGRSVAGFVWSYPLFHKWSYFEIEVLKRGVDGTITIGLCHSKYSTTRQPGWDSNSIGYHGDDGNLFHEQGHGKDWKGTPFQEGDVIGCGIDFDSDAIPGCCSVFFTKNGELIDAINTKIPNGGFYPMVGMHSQGEKVILNLLPHRARFNDDLEVDVDVDMGELRIVPSLYCYWRKVNTNVLIEENGYVLTHMGKSSGQDDIGLVQWHLPISRNFNCFQVEILQISGSIGVGLAIDKYNFLSFPGWEKNSIAYHADDGKMFHAAGFGAEYGDKCAAGDVMSVWVCFKTNELDKKYNFDLGVSNKLSCFSGEKSNSDDSDSGVESSEEDVWGGGSSVQVFFCKNGHKYRKISTDIPKGGYFPTIGLLNGGDKIKVTMQPYSG